MKRLFAYQSVRRLEKEGNNDLLLIKDLGPGYFPTKDLKRSLYRLNRQEKELNDHRNKLFLVGASGSLFLLASYIAKAAQLNEASLFFLAGAPLVLILFMVGHVLLRLRYPAYPYTLELRKAIEEELEYRRKESSIF